MTAPRPPLIDKRSYRRHLEVLAGEPLVVDGRRRLGLRQHYVPEWQPSPRPPGAPGHDLGQSMEMLFARLMDVLVEHLNRVPEKHFANFLDLVGLERRAGLPAGVPVTFTPAPKSLPGRHVPAGTQVATTQTDVAPAVVFETRTGFDLTPLSLAQVVSLDPAADTMRDVLPQLAADGSSAVPVLMSTAGDQEIEHSLYIAHAGLLSEKTQPTLTIRFTIAVPGAAPGVSIAWEHFDGETWQDMPSAAGGGAWVTGSGTIDVTIPDYPGTEASQDGGREDHWIRARVTVPLAPDAPASPVVSSIGLQTAPPEERLLAPEKAFTNTRPIDLNRDFLPFGPTPNGNDAFYVACDEAFRPTEPPQPRRVTVLYRLAPVPGAAVGEEFPDPVSTATLVWEYWKLSEVSEPHWEPITLVVSSDAARDFKEAAATPSSVQFDLPDHIGAVNVNGEEAFWIRIRIATGNYGVAARSTLVVTSNTIDEYTFSPATFQPPFLSINDLRIQYSLTDADDFVVPTGVATRNHDRTVQHAPPEGSMAAFRPFSTTAALLSERGAVGPSLYLGYVDPAADKRTSEVMRGFRISQLFSLESPGAYALTAEEGSDQPILVWEYLDANAAWRRLDADDDTRTLTGSAIVSFTAPTDMTLQTVLEQEAYWIRGRLASGRLVAPRRLRAVHLNSAMADSMRTVRNELLGSGTGEVSQTVRMSQTPVLPGERIIVRETNRPTDEAIAALEADEAARARTLGEAAEPVVIERPNPLTGEPEIWARWYAVPNFRFSTPESRHYVIDRVSGRVTFGALPDTAPLRAKSLPLAKDNVRAEVYRATGGGMGSLAGARNQVVVLKSALPFIAAVTNHEPAEGGSAPEALSDTLARGPQVLKHRNRSVTIEDFDALAREANSGIALVKTLPTTNRTFDKELGTVTILIVPRSDDRQPQPSPQMRDQVRALIAARSALTAAHRIHVVGPQYVDVSVAATIVATDPAEGRVVATRVSQALAAFLHPLNGGRDGEGWPLGRNARIAEIYALIEAVEGIDFVPGAEFRAAPDSDEVVVADNQLVSSGSHDITVTTVASALSAAVGSP